MPVERDKLCQECGYPVKPEDRVPADRQDTNWHKECWGAFVLRQLEADKQQKEGQ